MQESREKYRKEVERSKFEVTEVTDRNYTLFSEKYQKSWQVKINIYGVTKFQVGDVLELPDEMTIYNSGHDVLTERLLQFCLPNDNMSIPKGFNIELDYAYVTYKDTNERILIQRCYG